MEVTLCGIFMEVMPLQLTSLFGHFSYYKSIITKATGMAELARCPGWLLSLLTYKSSVNLSKSGFIATIFPSWFIR